MRPYLSKKWMTREPIIYTRPILLYAQDRVPLRWCGYLYSTRIPYDCASDGIISDDLCKTLSHLINLTRGRSSADGRKMAMQDPYSMKGGKILDGLIGWSGGLRNQMVDSRMNQ